MSGGFQAQSCFAQEAVEKLLQKSEAWNAEPNQEIYDKEFFGFTYGHYSWLVSQSFSWLPKGLNSVRPMQGSPFKTLSKHKLSVGGTVSKASSSHRLSVPARAASSPRLNTASTALPAPWQSFFSGESSKHQLKVHSRNQLSMQGKDQLSVHSSAQSTPKHNLPARRASILKLNVGGDGQSAQKHALPKRGRSALHFDLGSAPSSVDSRRSSWLSVGKNAVHPFADDPPESVHDLSVGTHHPQPASIKPQLPSPHRSMLQPRLEPKGIDASQLPSPRSNMLQSRTSSSSVQPQPNMESGAFSSLQTSPRVEISGTRSILRSKSSLTAASLFEAGCSMSSSDDDSSLAVPEDLVDSAMFLLRDTTLANPDAEVSALHAQHAKHTQHAPSRL